MSWGEALLIVAMGGIALLVSWLNGRMRGCIGLITHAAHTRDSRELVRIAEAMAKKGALA